MADLASELCALGVALSGERLAVLQQLLVEQDIRRVSDLACLGTLKDFPAFAQLSASELDCLDKICERQTKQWRSRGESVQPDALVRVREQVSLANNFDIDNVGRGPQAAVKRLRVVLTDEASRVEWVEKARITALLGSSLKSRGSFLSGVCASFIWP